MICPRCLLRAGSRGLRSTTNSTTSTTSAVRAFTTTRASPAKAPSTDAARSASPSAPATSTSAAQPFSTPLTPSPAAAGTPTKGASTPAALVQSSVPAGTPLKGLNFLKNKTDPVALEDAEYPAWLWTVLTPKGAGKEEAGESDLFAKSKKLRRIAAKRLRKQAMLHPELLAPKIPVYEQSVDLPAGDGSVPGGRAADQAREDLTKAMRTQRRKAIKEANFLRTMG